MYERITVTESNIDDIRESISACDQADAIEIGETISTWTISYGGGERGDITVWHDTDRAAVCTGGDSDWGDWSDRTEMITLDSQDDDGEPIIYDRDGRRLLPVDVTIPTNSDYWTGQTEDEDSVPQLLDNYEAVLERACEISGLIVDIDRSPHDRRRSSSCYDSPAEERAYSILDGIEHRIPWTDAEFWAAPLTHEQIDEYARAAARV